MLAKSTSWQSVEKACKPRMQVQLTQEAKIASDFLIYWCNFCGCGFVSALSVPVVRGRFFCFSGIGSARVDAESLHAACIIRNEPAFAERCCTPVHGAAAFRPRTPRFFSPRLRQVRERGLLREQPPPVHMSRIMDLPDAKARSLSPHPSREKVSEAAPVSRHAGRCIGSHAQPSAAARKSGKLRTATPSKS